MSAFANRIRDRQGNPGPQDKGQVLRLPLGTLDLRIGMAQVVLALLARRPEFVTNAQHL